MQMASTALSLLIIYELADWRRVYLPFLLDRLPTPTPSRKQVSFRVTALREARM